MKCSPDGSLARPPADSFPAALFAPATALLVALMTPPPGVAGGPGAGATHPGLGSRGHGAPRDSGKEEGRRPSLTPEDLLTVTRVEELRLTDDGQELLVVTSRRVQPDSARETVHRAIDVSTGARQVLSLPDGARDPAWRPETHHVSYLAPLEGAPQVWLDRGDGEPVALTHHRGGVRSYRWSPDGERIAFIAAGSNPAGQHGGKERGGRPAGGVEVDPGWMVVYRLFEDELDRGSPPVRELWVTALGGGGATRVSAEIHVDDYAWSPGSTRLAFTGRWIGTGAAGPGLWGVHRRDLYLWSSGGAEVRTLVEGSHGTPFRGGGYNFQGAVSIGRPVWGPEGRRLAFLRTDHTDVWAAVPSLRVFDLEEGKVRTLTRPRETEFYAPRFRWSEPDRILVANTKEARRGLFSISLRTGELEELIRSDARRFRFTFSESGDTVAWVREAVDHPPEVYVRAEGGGARRLTRLNSHLSGRWLPEVRREVWRSADGTEVQGWLLLPRDYGTDRTYPLLVALLGGPTAVAENEFDLFGSTWPYPLKLLADRGYAVLVPHYRGTGSFGKAFREPTAHHREPVADVLAAIEHLVEEGLADDERVGIMGHSHGAGLGPMVLARSPDQFVAAAFAEGAVDKISLYGQMPGYLNMNVHEGLMWGTTPYRDPGRYVDLSPIFDREVRSTPTLLEYGQESLAVQGLEYGSALWREGTDHQLVIYPDAGHNLRRPELKVDAMRRSLSWWTRWIEPGPSSGS